MNAPRFLFLQNTSVIDGYGGIEYYLDDLLSLLVEMGGEDSAATLVPQRSANFDRSPRPYAMYTIPFRSRGLLAKLQNRFSMSYFRAARELIRQNRPDFIVCGHVALGPMAYALHRATGVPYITCTYGIECWGNLRRADEWALRHAHHIWTISHWTKRILVERGYRGTGISVIHPRLPTHFEDIPPTPGRETNGLPFRLLTISRLDAREQYKGQDHVLEALHRLRLTEPGLKFHYIIQGQGSDRPRLRALVQEWGLEDIVEFRDASADREELAAVYRAADLFIMPSRYGFWDGRWRGEGFGIVYLEAAAFSVPSLAYDCGGATDIIEHNKNGLLVLPDDIAMIARTLATLSQDRHHLRTLGKRAYESTMRNFTRPAIQAEIASALTALSLGRPESATMSQSHAATARSRARSSR